MTFANEPIAPTKPPATGKIEVLRFAVYVFPIARTKNTQQRAPTPVNPQMQHTQVQLISEILPLMRKESSQETEVRKAKLTSGRLLPFFLIVGFAALMQSGALNKMEYVTRAGDSIGGAPESRALVDAHEQDKVTGTGNTTSQNIPIPPIMDEQAQATVETEKEQKPQLTFGPIFYNYFVPPPKANSAVRIAREQQLERNKTAPNDFFWYTLIGGDPKNHTPEVAEIIATIKNNEWCAPNCSMREYLHKGDEVDTYQALWQYCMHHPNEIITYSHDRGSFHPGYSNEKSRRFGTKAAFHCRPILKENIEHCNVCTSKFHSSPQYLSSANMWTAHCDYVRQLIPPKVYSASMEAMYKDTLFNLEKAEYNCLRPGTQTQENHLGLNRYAPERWIFDHPHVKPCDVLPYSLKNAPDTFPQTWEPIKNPRPPRKAGYKFGVMKASFGRLIGRLYQWQYLYGKAPPEDSWIWKAYANPNMYEGVKDILKNCLNQTGSNYTDTINARILSSLTPEKYRKYTKVALDR